jgi:amidase
MREPLHRLSATELAHKIALGDLESEIVARSFLDAVREHERAVQAFAWFDGDRALAIGHELDRVTRRGPLHGLPIAVKDIVDTAGIPTGYGSPIFINHRPVVDAACVALLKDAGGYVLGKTVTAELANVTPGPTRNPHQLEHTPGGSSSGSAAAVAAHMAPLAIGTQTVGSVIRPAAYCGVVGYKPSPRVLPRAGIKMNSDTLDEIGVFARTVEDAALLASVLALKPAWKELPSQALISDNVPTFAVTATPHASAAAPSMRAALDTAAHRLRTHHARYAELTWPRVFDGLFEANKTVQLFETARALGPEYAYRRDALSQRLVELIDHGRAIETRTYVEALQLGRACAAAIESLFGEAAVILAPSAPGEAPRGLTSTGDPLFNRPWQLLGCPVINLPFGQGESGLPLGISVVARPGDDARLFSCAAWIERALRAA